MAHGWLPRWEPGQLHRPPLSRVMAWCSAVHGLMLCCHHLEFPHFWTRGPVHYASSREGMSGSWKHLSTWAGTHYHLPSCRPGSQHPTVKSFMEMRLKFSSRNLLYLLLSDEKKKNYIHDDIFLCILTTRKLSLILCLLFLGSNIFELYNLYSFPFFDSLLLFLWS